MPMSQMGAAGLRLALCFAIRAQQWSDPGDSFENSGETFSCNIRSGSVSDESVLPECVSPDMFETHPQFAQYAQQSRYAMAMMFFAG